MKRRRTRNLFLFLLLPGARSGCYSSFCIPHGPWESLLAKRWVFSDTTFVQVLDQFLTSPSLTGQISYHYWHLQLYARVRCTHSREMEGPDIRFLYRQVPFFQPILISYVSLVLARVYSGKGHFALIHQSFGAFDTAVLNLSSSSFLVVFLCLPLSSLFFG